MAVPTADIDIDMGVDIDIGVDIDSDADRDSDVDRRVRIEEVVKVGGKVGYPLIINYIDRSGKKETSHKIVGEGELRNYLKSSIFSSSKGPIPSSNSIHKTISKYNHGKVILQRVVEGRELQVTLLRDSKGSEAAFPER